MGVCFNRCLLWVTVLTILNGKTKCEPNVTKSDPLELSTILLYDLNSWKGKLHNETNEFFPTFSITTSPWQTHAMQRYPYIWFPENTTSKEYLLNFMDVGCTLDQEQNTSIMNATSQEINIALQKHKDPFLKKDTTPKHIPFRRSASGFKHRNRTTYTPFKDFITGVSSTTKTVVFKTSLTNSISKTTLIGNHSQTMCRHPYQFPCSCSPQCKNYDVCCADVYSEEELMTKSIGLECATVEEEVRRNGLFFGTRDVKFYAVSGCPGMNRCKLLLYLLNLYTTGGFL